ncbi:hypothetical protein [Flavobacterium lipolyticum]|uniref:Lipocalin-like domain-containing protein n=1 Tax=Flavobacterium lipolyticum TaxID=2893754 RepID=A0ABS8LWN1_9FLAO|nr:hypothetical protein [Flavobacterium sp. F-126]MCC9016975.1 hypothetical protein [Flavobacterium sp. F-126]
MKKFTLLFILIAILGCSSDNNESKKSLPEKFDVKIVIKSSSGTSPKTSISVNSSNVKEWTNVNLPFEGAYTYFTTGNEISNTSCKCITISAWSYLSKADKIESFNLYVDGKLVNSTSTIAGADANGILKPTILDFVYNP